MNRCTPICISLIFLLVGLSSPAGADTVTIDKDVLNKILQRQDELEKKVQHLEKQLEDKQTPSIPAPSTLPPVQKPEVQAEPQPQQAPLAEDVKTLKEDVNEMSGRLDKVETRSLMDKVQIGGEFRVQMEYLNFDNFKKADGQKTDSRVDELWTGRLRLNLRSEVTEDIIFNGRLSYLKYWGETNSDIDPNDRRYYMEPTEDGYLHVERAYVDWFIPQTPFSLTFGRLPTSDGPPYEFKNFTSRKATWPQLFVDGEIDGIIASMDMEPWTGWKSAMFRLAYAKISQNYQQYQGYEMDPCRVGGIHFETRLPEINDSLMWIGYYRAFDVGPLEIPGARHPEDAGNIDNYTLHLQLGNIRNTGLGWFASFTYQNILPRDEGTVLGPGYEVGMVGDSLNGDLGENRNAYHIYTGLRYILPIEALKNPHIGFEFNYGSQYWLPASNSDVNEFTNKFGVNGKAYELYYIQPISENHMFFRIGMIYQDYDYYPPMYFYGSRETDAAKSDMSILNTYFLMDVRF
jgi:hypothetical protein